MVKKKITSKRPKTFYQQIDLTSDSEEDEEKKKRGQMSKLAQLQATASKCSPRVNPYFQKITVTPVPKIIRLLNTNSVNNPLNSQKIRPVTQVLNKTFPHLIVSVSNNKTETPVQESIENVKVLQNTRIDFNLTKPNVINALPFKRALVEPTSIPNYTIERQSSIKNNHSMRKIKTFQIKNPTQANFSRFPEFQTKSRNAVDQDEEVKFSFKVEPYEHLEDNRDHSPQERCLLNFAQSVIPRDDWIDSKELVEEEIEENKNDLKNFKLESDE